MLCEVTHKELTKSIRNPRRRNNTVRKLLNYYKGHLKLTKAKRAATVSNISTASNMEGDNSKQYSLYGFKC